MNEDDERLTISAAARRLGVTRGAIQGRIKRRTIETKPFGNHGILVRVPRDVAPSQQLPNSNPAATWHANALEADLEATREQLIERDRQIATQAMEIAGLKAERDGLHARLADKGEELRVRLADKDEQISDLRSERDRLLRVIEVQTEQVKLPTDQRQQPPEPSKSRWRRWFSR